MSPFQVVRHNVVDHTRLTHFWITVCTLLICTAVISAQDFDYLTAILGYPACAVSCIRDVVKKTHCGETDVKCLCWSDWQTTHGAFMACLTKSEPGCDESDMNKTLAADTRVCSPYRANWTDIISSNTTAGETLYSSGRNPKSMFGESVLSMKAYLGAIFPIAVIVNIALSIGLCYLYYRRRRRMKMEGQEQFNAMADNVPMISELAGSNIRWRELSEMPEECRLLEAPGTREVTELDSTELGRDFVTGSTV